jgi:hypothetical protein
MNWIIIETKKCYFIHDKAKPLKIMEHNDDMKNMIAKSKKTLSLEWYYINELDMTIYIPILIGNTRSLISKWCYEYLNKLQKKYAIPRNHIENIKNTTKWKN